MTGHRGRPTPVRTRLELRRGRRSLVAIALGAALAVVLGAGVLAKLDVAWPWERTLTFEVEVASAAGVSPGRTNVTVAGVRAGRVTDVRTDGEIAVMRVEIDRAFGPVARNATLRLQPRTPLQDMVLDVVDRGSGEPLRSSDRLGVDATQTAVAIGPVLDVFSAPTRGRLRTLLVELAEGLEDRGRDLRRSFVALVPFLTAAERLTREIGRRDRLARRLVSDSATLLDELARRDDAVEGLVADGGRTLRALGGERGALGRTIDELAPTVTALEDATTALTTALRSTSPALRELRAPVGRLPSALSVLDDLGREARPALARLEPTLAALAPALRRLTPAARTVRSAAEALTPQVPRLERVVGDVLTCRGPLAKFFHNTLSFYKYGGPYGPIGRSELTFGTAQVLGDSSPSESMGPMCYDGSGKAGG